MKTIFSNGTYSRVSDEMAATEVSFRRATYAPKSEWKRTVRDVTKTVSETVVVAEVKGEVTKSKKAAKAAKLKKQQRPVEYTDKFIR